LTIKNDKKDKNPLDSISYPVKIQLLLLAPEQTRSKFIFLPDLILSLLEELIKMSFQKMAVRGLQGGLGCPFGAFFVSSPQLGAFKAGIVLPYPENKFI